MNLHKYVVEGKKVFVISSESSKPSGMITLRQGDWKGKALGRFNTVIEQLGKLEFTKEEKEEPKEEKGKSKGRKILSEIVRKFAESIKE
jgi:hypothetical protein